MQRVIMATAQVEQVFVDTEVTRVSYSIERNAQIIVSLLKQHGVKKVIASPGTTNIPLVVTFQNDPFFTVFSSVDERSAAYIACGMAATSGEPVVISCTGATASRNYAPGLTEAYYRKLPVIAITSFNGNQKIGQLVPQNLDRTIIQNDVAKKSVQVPVVKDSRDAEYCNRIVNDAILESMRAGCGPVHINVETSYDSTFLRGVVPQSRCIKRYCFGDAFPRLDQNKKIVISIGAHRVFSKNENLAIEKFVRTHNAVVFCDHTSNYTGYGALLSTLATDNTRNSNTDLSPDLIIFIGEVSGDYPTANFLSGSGAASWRVSPDGEIRDRFNTLRAVFQCSEEFFFNYYNSDLDIEDCYLEKWQERDLYLRSRLPELPFSGRWIAQRMSILIPQQSIIHFAILNALRAWNYFPLPKSVRCFCNTGGFGIDGTLSTVFGSALAEPETLHFCVIGDLAFFYDMNVLGNRDFCRNIRILLINNGVGDEMHMSYSIGNELGKDVFDFVAAQGHFKSKTSQSAAEAWGNAMGIKYFKAKNEQEFLNVIGKFMNPAEKIPMILECCTTPDSDMEAGKLLTEVDPGIARNDFIKRIVRKTVPKNVLEIYKRQFK